MSDASSDLENVQEVAAADDQHRLTNSDFWQIRIVIVKA